MRLSFSVLVILLLLAAPGAAQTVPPVVAAAPEPPDATREELLRRAREAKKDIVHPPRKTTLEKWIARVEPLVMTPPVRRTQPRRGFYPRFGSVAPGGGWAVGPGYRYERLAGGEIDADVSARMSWKRYWALEGRLRMPRLNGGRTALGVFGRLRDMPQEDFYGFGPGSDRDSRVSYALRELAVGATGEHRLGEGLSVYGGADFIRPVTREGTDTRYPSIEALFDTSALPGFAGEPDFTVLRAGAVFDRTDQPGNPRSGPQYRVEASRWNAGGGAPLTFNALHADVRQFIPFFNSTRVIALRGAVWHTDPAEGAEVPLYYQPVLGGGRALRGYSEFRFRDRSALLLQAEYRYNLFPGTDGVVFYEAGTVGRSLGDLDSLKSDYGLGVRFGSAEGVFMRVEAAFGTPESPRFYIKFSNAF
ncbi:MAG TPA: BamA/TamA family outer membrane protein [Vicinamibacterales bacterium]|nr:BamA/TamA family outer membrane protein [Vicinamibacterales bacterium]